MSTDMDYQPVTNNDLIEKVMQSSAPEEESRPAPDPAKIALPTDAVFDLPGGYVSPTGEVAYEAEVRELTGRDEEQISKAPSLVKGLGVILQRGLVRVGDTKVDESVLNDMLAGDRDYALIRIYAATFGPEVTASRYCVECEGMRDYTVDLLKDVPIRKMENSGDRFVTVECSVGEVGVTLPTGVTQKKLMESNDKTIAELSTLLLENTVVAVNGKSILDPQRAVLDLSIRDRRKISEVIATSSPGPQMGDTKAKCPECDTETEVPLNLASLFQFQ